jgi:nucleotide-binding universal stress UspA family protein
MEAFMIGLKTVLVATDFSDASDAAVEYGCTLAERFGALLHVLTVIPDVAAVPWGAFGDGLSLSGTIQQWEREALPRLETLLTPIERETVHAQFVTRVGDPTAQILMYAAEHEIDLIVVGTHGHRALTRVILGSVAERVVRLALCPVLMARHAHHYVVAQGEPLAAAAAPIS